MILDIEGLLRGKRLRKVAKVCPDAWLLYGPLLLMSNSYARTELDYDALAEKFVFLGSRAPDADTVESYFEAYREAHLVYVYEGAGQRWAQFDTMRSRTNFFKTAPSQRSPNPPEPEYTEWLKEQHDELWHKFHWDSSHSKGIDGEDEKPAKGKVVPKRTRKPDTDTVPDLRWTDFKNELDAHLKQTIPNEAARPVFHPDVTVPLKKFLKDHDKLDARGFASWLKHRAESDKVVFTDLPRVWLPHLARYENGPLDVYGKPKQVIRSAVIDGPRVNAFAEQQRSKRAAAMAERSAAV